MTPRLLDKMKSMRICCKYVVYILKDSKIVELPPIFQIEDANSASHPPVVQIEDIHVARVVFQGVSRDS